MSVANFSKKNEVKTQISDLMSVAEQNVIDEEKYAKQVAKYKAMFGCR